MRQCSISNWFTIKQRNKKWYRSNFHRIVSYRLNSAKDSLINRKIYKILAITNINQITNWVKTKGIFNCVSATFDELKKNTKTYNFAFSFHTEILEDLLSFQFTLLNSDNKKLNSSATKRKSAYWILKQRS